MAFPTVVTTASFQDSSAANNPVSVTLPASLVSGNLILLIFRCGTTVTASTPSGWSLLLSRTNNSYTTYIFSKVSNGSEGGSVSITLSSNARTVAIGYQIGNWTPSAEGLFASTDVNNPPELTPTWGAEDTLWIAGLTNTRSDSNVISAPTNFSNLITIANSSSSADSRARASSAIRFNNSASEDPGAFGTTGTLNNMHSFTIGIRGIAESSNPAIARRRIL